MREDPPTPPSRIAGPIDRDLETVCLKCLEKAPGSRYARPSALADDLERWLRGEPIDARPVGRWERARRWCRRNPEVAALSAGLVTVAAFALVAGVLMVDRIRRESAEVVTQSLRAGANIRHALHGISRLHARVQDRGLDRIPEAAALRRDISRQALTLLRTIIDGEQPGPSVGVDIASTFQHIAEIEFNDGLLSEADATMSRSITLLDALLARGPEDAGALYLRAQSHHILALQHAASGRHGDISAHCEQAERDYRRCLALNPDGYDALNGTSWFLAIAPDPGFRAPEEAVVLARRGVSIFPRSAGLWNDLGVALHRAGRWAEAVTALETSRRLRDDHESAHDGFFLSMALAKLGRGDEAREQLGRATAWMDRNDPRHHELLLFRAEAIAALNESLPMPDGPEALLGR
ncbi:MAG: tetratricopeptide repeat protein [Isosphaeraceae bacterium]